MMLRVLGAMLYAGRRLETLCLRRYWVSRFREAGRNISIGEQFQAYGPEHICVEEGVVLANRVTLRAMTSYPWADPPQTFQPRMTLRKGCFINNGSQISCGNRVTVGENVMIAENCFIADNNHSYEDATRGIKQQPLRCDGEVTIGDDTWIGASCCIVGSVRVGRHCVVGAHSVVTTDLPDFSVAVGAPARVIRAYDPDAGAWREKRPAPE